MWDMKAITLCFDPHTDTCLTLRATLEGDRVVLFNEERGVGYAGQGESSWSRFDA